MNTRVEGKADTRGVFKFRHAGVIYYRLGRDLNQAILTLARELKTEVIYIEILEKGGKQ
jgi:hypothetical protein